MDVDGALKLNFETPFMVVDLEQTKKNILKMQDLAKRNGKRLRPHSKTHKIPEISNMQVQEGAYGICVQKTAEAEVMFQGGVRNILLSNETYGSKFFRLAKLISDGADLTVAVDNSNSVEQFSNLCRCFDVMGNVIIDINIGMNRCGIEPNNLEKVLVDIKKYSNLNLVGAMAYDGQVDSRNPKNREEEVKREESILAPLVRKIENISGGEPVISVAGTPTVDFWANSTIPNELQPGTYVYYDIHCLNQELCTIDEISMGVVSTCTSENIGERFVLDAGYKSVAIDHGVYPTVIDENRKKYKVVSMSEEHTVLKPYENDTKLGKRFLMLPYHACTTTDLWDITYVINKTHQPYSFVIRGRGKRE